MAPASEGGWSVGWGDHELCTVMSHPDATLIAAAPELLEAAQELLDAWDDYDMRLARLVALRKAVAKAEGRPYP